MSKRNSVVARTTGRAPGGGADPATATPWRAVADGLPLALGLALLVLLSASSALAQEQRQVAVLNLVHFNGPKEARNLLEKERFDSFFARGLETAGWSVVQATDENCNEGVDCLAAIAKRLGVVRVVRITGQGNVQIGYQLNVEAFRPKLARTEKGTLYCDTCNQTRAAELAAADAQKQLAAVARAAAGEEDSPTPPVVTAPTPPTEPDHGSVAPPPSGQPASYRWVAWTLLGTGAAAMAVGGWALSKHEGETGEIKVRDGRESRPVYSSATLGTACLVSGGVAAIAGVVWLLATPSSQAGIAASPNHVALHVRF